MTVPQHEHDHDRDQGAQHPHRQRSRDEATQHPLLDLQQQAGNAAVAQLIAVQRHTLDPEDEHG